MGLWYNVPHYSLLVLALAREGKLVLWLAVWDLVDTEPLIGGPEKARKVPLNVLNIIELGSQRVVDVNDDDLPVGLLLVEQSHHAEDLDLLHLAGLGDELADLTDVEGVVVAFGFGLGVDDVGVFPCLLCVRSSAMYMIVGVRVFQARLYAPEGRHRSSRDNPCAGSSYGQIGACPS